MLLTFVVGQDNPYKVMLAKKRTLVVPRPKMDTKSNTFILNQGFQRSCNVIFINFFYPIIVHQGRVAGTMIVLTEVHRRKLRN